jgi:hypothetical protein
MTVVIRGILNRTKSKPRNVIIAVVKNMTKRNKKPKKPKKRNPYATIAKFRNSAGPIKDKKKEENKDKCREERMETWEDIWYNSQGHEET